MNDVVLKTNKLTKIYGKQKAVNNVSIEVKAGEIYGLIGENGSGKSTILKMLVGMVLPTSGEIEILKESDEKGLVESRSKIGAVIESPAFYSYMSAKENLEYYRIQRGILDEHIVEESLNLVGLKDVGKKKFKAFSLGMKQRLGLAYAIMINPEILILDEPINGLDPTGIVELRHILLNLNREKRTTIIISSHILKELSQVATNYGFINKGRILKQVSKEDLMKECKEYLVIKVTDLNKATVVLEKKLNTLDYKVTNEEEIYLYKYIDEPEKVVEEFAKESIYIKSIEERGSSLEDYYIELMAGDKDE